MPFNQILELAVVILANTACKMLKKKKKKDKTLFAFSYCFLIILHLPDQFQGKMVSTVEKDTNVPHSSDKAVITLI